MADKKENTKALVLISSGIDSPVAAKMMQERGLEIIGIHYHNFPFTDHRPLEKTKKLCRKLGIKKLYVVKHGLSMKDALSKFDRRYTCLICRRFMFRIAERIAEKEGCKYLVTGESLGQVASQTLENLTVCASAVKITILRPLLGFDKQETVNLAKRYGTYDISIEPSYCCKLVPPHPATRSTIGIIEGEERKIDIEGTIKERLKDMDIIEL